MLLSIIIVNYNSRQLLDPCLYSLKKACSFLPGNTEIIVVDNNSSDGSREFLEKINSEVIPVFNHDNPGFAKACNAGLKKSRGQYILFLNPDTLVPENCLRQCISFFENTPLAGAAGVRMTDGQGRFLKESKRGFPSPAASFFKLFGLAFLFPRSPVFAKYYLGHLPETENNEAEVLSGAFMMLKNEVLKKTGGFDERFFLYGEDIDLSYRVWEAGYKNYYLGQITITHFKGGSTTYNAEYLDRFYGAMHLFVNKHFKGKKPAISVWVLHAGIHVRKLIAAMGLLFR
jgi:O-antigen biosynthesis protein